MSNSLISVVLPVFNGEKYISEAIESILDQTYQYFEFIIVNDGSTDATESIILRYNDPRIRYYKQENGGIGRALRHGCDLANGVFLARMDADDISFPDRFQRQVAYLESHPSTIPVSSAVIYIDENGSVSGRSFPYTSDFAIRKKLKTMNPICHPGVMMRAEAYKCSIGYLNIQPFEDHILWLSLSGSGKLHNFRFPLLSYRVLNESLSRSVSVFQSQKLFNYLTEKLNHGGFTDAAITAYNHLYKEEKKNAAQALSNIKPHGDQDKTNAVTSEKQMMLYHWLKLIRMPETLIEHVICSFKNVFLSYQRN